jgi:hypothetical protein
MSTETAEQKTIPWVMAIAEAKECPSCGKLMIRRERIFNYVLKGGPRQAWYWWCGCGYQADGGDSADDIARILWEDLNRPQQNDVPVEETEAPIYPAKKGQKKG